MPYSPFLSVFVHHHTVERGRREKLAVFFCFFSLEGDMLVHHVPYGILTPGRWDSNWLAAVASLEAWFNRARKRGDWCGGRGGAWFIVAP